MTVYLGGDRQRTAQQLTATRNSVRIDKEDTRTWPQTVYKDNYFSSPDLFDDFAT